MTYIKLLTVLTTLALLTACGGAAAPADKTGGDTTTDCETNAFHADCDAVESAITSRQTTCFASATANRRCGVVIEGACRANPFRAETACMADTYLPARIAECIKGGEADEGKCATITTDAEKNTMVIGCLKNPFDIVCQTSVADFATYTATARMNRLTFCNDGGNVADDLCTGNNLVIICSTDPFNAICFTDDTYLSPRITNCITAGNAGEEKCNTLLTDTAMNAAITSCLTNPFATACESVTAFTDFALARTNRVSFCDMAGNNTNALCMGANLMGVCDIDSFNAICLTDATYDPNRQTRQVQCVVDSTAHTNCPAALRSLDGVVDITDITGITTPTGVIDHADLPATVALAIANTDTQSHFLSVDEEDGIDKTELTGNLTDNTLRLGGVDTDTEDTNGVAYVLGVIEGTAQSFVGLLPTTNLGAPLPSTTADATWAGRYYHGANREIHDIDFNIDFGTGEIEATDIQGNITTKFDLDFTAEGVITGDVIINPDTEPDTAEARGLIGEQGLVGGFANTDDVGIWGANFFGGFVADNPATDGKVDYDDWLAIGATVALPSTPAINEFISGILAAGVPDEDGSVANHRSYGANTLNNAIHKDGTFGGDANDGVVPVNATNGSYVGILPTTNLGAPLTEPTASAEWQGVLWGAHTRTSERGSFTPTINFTAKTITGTVADRAVGDTDFAVISGNNFPTGVNYSFTASFDNPRGQLTGTITRTVDSVASAGTIRGIIGEEGAVAGFISDAGADLSYAGGFVACPYDETNNRCQRP